MSDYAFAGFITVRTSSSRLPAKCLLPFGDGTVVNHMIRRARAFAIEPIVCTSVDVSDDPIEEISVAEGARCFRGSLSNKLKRWSDCAEQFGLAVFHTLDADDPFFDGEEMAQSMALLTAGRLDMVCPTDSSSAGGGSVGYSLTGGVVKRACAGLSDEADTEMMWHYVERLPGLRTAVLPELHSHRAPVRLTLDYQEDYWLLESVRRMVGNVAPRAAVDDLFRRNPDLYQINWYRNQEWKSAQAAKSPASPVTPLPL